MNFPKHLDFLEKEIEEVIELKSNKITILTVSMPPRSGKTILASRKLPALYLKKYPERRVMLSSYSQEISDINCDAAGRLFSGKDKNSISTLMTISHGWGTSKNGSCRSVKCSSALCGQPIDLFIIDDYCKNLDDAFNVEYQKNIENWFNSIVVTRMNVDGIIIVIGSRWMKNDLVFKIQEKFELDNNFNLLNINIPAITNNESYWPENYKTSDLLKTNKLIGDNLFSTLYQGNPSR